MAIKIYASHKYKHSDRNRENYDPVINMIKIQLISKGIQTDEYTKNIIKT